MSVQKGLKFFNAFPEGVFALFFIQVFSTLSFSVLYSTLVLYMTGPLKLNISSANSIMGVFVAFNYALHLLGGFWSGRFFSNRALFILGMSAQVIACLLLAIESKTLLVYGLAFFLSGAGVNVTCLNCLLTERFSPNDHRRESAFLYNYAGMNIGFFIGFTLSGYFQLYQNYHLLFILSSIGNLIALFLCGYNWAAFRDTTSQYAKLPKPKQKVAVWQGLIMFSLLPILLSQLLQFADFASKLVLFTGVLMLGAVYFLAMQQASRQAREKLFAFGVLMVISTIFWTLYQIAPMGLTHFITHNVKRNLFTMNIPPQWFQNVNTFCIVLGGPLLSIILNHLRKKGWKISISIQFALSLILIGLAFTLLPVGIYYANNEGLIEPSWVVTYLILQSCGELLISPIGYAMIGALAPTSLQGVMMGMWMFASGVGATLSSYCSNWMTISDSVDPIQTNPVYSNVFLWMGLIAVISGSLLLAIRSLLNRWMQQGDSDDSVNLVTASS